MSDEASSNVESAWLEKVIAFTSAEMEGRDEAGSSQYWRGVVARLKASVGQAPTARTEPVHRLMLAACEQFEDAATDGNPDGMREGTKLFGLAGERLRAITEEIHRTGQETVSSLPFELPSSDEVRFSSAAIVKRRKLSYGKKGILLLAGDRLIFITDDPTTTWEIAVPDIAHLKSPWYGMGSYLTFDVNGAYYAFAFGQRGAIVSLESGSSLAARFGGIAGAGLGLAGDAVAVSKMVKGAALGGEWLSWLGAKESSEAARRAADAAEAEWQAQQARARSDD
jgi:hypothetical protein